MKLTKFQKTTALVLCLIMTAIALVSCGNTNTPVADTTETPVAGTSGSTPVETTENPYDEKGYLKDKIPETLKLNTTLTMLYWSDVENVEFFVESQTGETVQDSVYERNLRTEERLGVKVEYVGTKGNYENNAAFVSAAKAAKAGGSDYDLYAAYSMTTASCAYSGLCRNLLNYEIIDFSAPWWPDNLINEAKIGGKLFFASGDLSTNLLYMMYPIYFNKELISNYNLEDPYTLVKNNQWTYEKLFTMAAAAEADSVGTADSKIYGYVQYSNVHCDPWFYGAGLRTVDRDSNGGLVISELWGNELTGTIAEQVQKFMNSAYSNIADGSAQDFANGKAIFTLDRARYASRNLSEATFEYGIVPMPKYTSEQENYSTCLGFPYTLYAITDSSKQPEACAALLECWCSEGYRIITPALFDITMKFKYTSDSDAGMMFDIIRSTVSFDVGRIYCTQLSNMSYSIFRSYVSSTSPSVSYSTQFSTNKRSITKALENLQKAFDKIEG